MGINSIKCDGLYAETGKTGFGEGTRSSSDFDYEGLLAGGTLPTIAITAGIALCIYGLTSPREKTYLFDKNYSEPEKHATSDAPQVTQSHYTEFSFTKRGETGLVSGEFTNSSYRLDFNSIEQPFKYSFDHKAHLSITDVNTSETKSLVIEDGRSIDIDVHYSASADISDKYANITIKETEALNK